MRYCLIGCGRVSPEHIRAARENGLEIAALCDIDSRGASWEKEWGADVSKCTECGACEAKCPQKLPVIEQLKETHKVLAI